jgi:predicted nucleic acid-binding protein
MYLIDTSIWINIFRDKTGIKRKKLENIIQDNPFFLSHFTQNDKDFEIIKQVRNLQTIILN